MIPQQKQVFLDALESKADVLITSIYNVAINAAETEDYDDATSYGMDLINGNSDVHYLVFTRSDGSSLVLTEEGSSMEGPNGQGFHGSSNSKSAGTICISPLVDTEAFRYSSEFKYSEDHRGWIHVGLSLAQYNAGIEDVIRRTVLVGLVCTMASGFALNEESEKERGNRTDYICKPYHERELLQKVREMLDRCASAGE